MVTQHLRNGFIFCSFTLMITKQNGTGIRTLLWLCCAMVSFKAVAQTDVNKMVKISGRVVSAVTGDAIPYCQITYPKNRGTISDSLGFFELTDLHAGSYKIHFQTPAGVSYDTLVALREKDLIGSAWAITSACTSINRDLALSDIRNGHLKLFLQSGDPPISYSNEKHFSKKYKVQFHDFADLISSPFDCLVIYNRIIFQHLDEKFGRKWRKDIRPDVPGYK